MKADNRLIIGIFVIIFVFALGYSTVSSYLVEYKTVSEAVRETPQGMVWVNGTILKGSFTSLNTGEYTFIITDGASEMNVSFTGELPYSLGAEAEIVMQGAFRDNTFYATRMIAKCPSKFQG